MGLIPVTPKDVEKQGEDAIWAITTVRTIDCERIEIWLKETAQTLVPSDVAAYDKDKREGTIKSACEKYVTLSDNLAGFHNVNAQKVGPKLLQDATSNNLRKQAPSKFTIFSWLFLLVLAGGLEFAFFGYIFFQEDAGVALPGSAILLFVGGFMVGMSMAGIMDDRHQSEYEGVLDHKNSRKNLAVLGIGILLVAGIIGFRWVGGGPTQGIVAFLFGLAVATSEAFYSHYKQLRKHYMQEMFRAQSAYAANELSHDMRGPGPEDDKWQKNYYRYVAEFVDIADKTRRS